jgi:release factor glutamine methyltransferase
METIASLTKEYRKKIDFLDLEIILAHSLGKTREFVLAHPEYKITKHKLQITNNFLKRRMKGEPIAYITGHKEFYGLDFTVNKNTLVPRPETEQIVEEVMKLHPKNKMILDIGTGSGNMVISLAKNIQNENDFVAIDISKEALLVARKNARKNGVNKKIKFIQADLLSKTMLLDNVIITANLPYLNAEWKNLLNSAETRGLKFEPSIALYAGKDGLDAYKKLAEQIKLTSTKNSILFCEIGHLQMKGMRKIFSFAGKVEFFKDLAGKWRVCKITL